VLTEIPSRCSRRRRCSWFRPYFAIRPHSRMPPCSCRSTHPASSSRQYRTIPPVLVVPPESPLLHRLVVSPAPSFHEISGAGRRHRVHSGYYHHPRVVAHMPRVTLPYNPRIESLDTCILAGNRQEVLSTRSVKASPHPSTSCLNRGGCRQITHRTLGPRRPATENSQPSKETRCLSIRHPRRDRRLKEPFPIRSTRQPPRQRTFSHLAPPTTMSVWPCQLATVFCKVGGSDLRPPDPAARSERGFTSTSGRGNTRFAA